MRPVCLRSWSPALAMLVVSLTALAPASADFTFPVQGPLISSAPNFQSLDLGALGIPAGTYIGYNIAFDWAQVAGGPWSNEARIGFSSGGASSTTQLGTVYAGGTAGVGPTTGGASSSAPAFLTFSGFFTTPYSGGTDPLFLNYRQTFSTSQATWSNVTITLTTTPPQPPPSTQVDGPIQTLFGNLAAGSVDWYVFDYDGTTALSISTTGVVTGTALDTHIAIFNSLGGLIAQNDDIAGVSNRNSQFVANGGLALGALTTDLGALAAGTYYLAVSPFLQSASNGFTVTGGSATAGLGEYSVTFSGVQPIPEPGTYALIGLGLAATTIWGRRRSRV